MKVMLVLSNVFMTSIGLFSLLVVNPSYATSLYWDTNSTTAGFNTVSGTWGTNNYWNTDSTGGAGTFSTTTTSTDDVFFGSATDTIGAGTVTISGTVNANGFDFAQSTGAITLTGGTINLRNGAGIRSKEGGGTASNTHTIDSNISMSSSSLRFGTQNTNAEKYIVNGVISGGMGLNGRMKNGSGVLTLNALNTFTGNPSLVTGQYDVNTIADSGSASSLGAGSLISMGGGGGQAPRIVYTGSAVTSTDRTIVANLTGTAVIIAKDGAIDFTGTMKGATTTTKTYQLGLSGTAGTGSNKVSGVIQDGAVGAKLNVKVVNVGAVGVTGEAGYWVFSGTNTYTGTTTVKDSSTLQLGDAGTTGVISITSSIDVASGSKFIVNQTDTVTQGTDFSTTLTGAGSVTMAGSGTLEILIDTGVYTGDTIVDNGTIRLVNTADLRNMNSNNMYINNGSTLEIFSNVGGSNRTTLLSDTIFTFDSNGGGTIVIDKGNHLKQGGTAGSFVTTGGTKNTISTANGGFINPQGSNTVTFDVADGTDVVDLEFSARMINGKFHKKGAGVVAVIGHNKLTGGAALTIDAGTFEVGGAGQLTTNGQVTSVVTSLITNNGTYSQNSTADQTLSGVISGTGVLTKSNTGTLTLRNTSANTYTGGTTIDGGIISLGSGGGAETSHQDALGTGTVTVNTGGELRLWIKNNASYTIDNAFTLDGGAIHAEDGTYDVSGNITLAAGGGTLSGKYNNKNPLFSGVISGAGDLTIDRLHGGSGDAAVRLSGTNTYTGNTISRILNVTGAGSLGSGTYAGAIANSVTLTFATSADQTLSGVISGTGALNKSSTGTLTLSNTNTYNGLTTATAGTLDVTGSIGGALTVNGGTVTTDASGSVAGALTMTTGSISPGTRTSNGTLNIGANSTWTGGTYVWSISGGMADSGSNASSGGSDTYNEATGVVGMDWDYMAFTGSLDFDGASAGSITIDIDSNGTYTGYDWDKATEVKIIGAASIANFDASFFNLDSSGFDDNAGSWWVNWGIASHDNALWLQYKAVPEPSTYVMFVGVFGLLFINCLIKRRKT